MAIADKIALMQGGELLQMGAPMELYHRPSRREVAEFFGSMNWVKGRVIQSCVADTQIGPVRFRGAGSPGDKILLGFRPECLSIVEELNPNESNIFQAILRSSTFLGDQFTYNVAVADQLFVGKGRAVPVNTHGQLYLSVHPADLMVFPDDEKASETSY
jgi:ABC-type Fe3+/spermidine/putrescine transport system ATPase subunit